MRRFFTVLCIFLYTSVSMFGQTNLKKHVSWYRPTIAAEIWYTDGQGRQQGTHTFYSRNGKIELTQQFINDMLDGKTCSYYENGRAATEWSYRKGVMIKMVSYEYISFNNQPAIYVKQSIINLDNNGDEIEKWKISYATKQLVQVKGILPDGRKWSLTTPCTAMKATCDYVFDTKSDSYRMYNSYMEEPIDKSDTTYVWYDKSKTQLQSKSFFINVPTLFKERGLNSSKFYEHRVEIIWSPDGTLISDGVKSTEELIMARTEQNYNDSIVEVNKIQMKEMQMRLDKEKQDAIAQRKIEYQNLLTSIRDIDLLYADVINKYAQNSEYLFYGFLCSYIKKNKNFDSRLKDMIVNVTGITADMVTNKKLRIDAVRLYHAGSWILAIQADRWNYVTTTNNVVNYSKDERFISCLNGNKRFIEFDSKNGSYLYNVNMIIPNEVMQMYEYQKQLIDIIQYCNQNSIMIK